MSSPRAPLLVQRFPRLRERVPWLPLGTFPTPVRPMTELGRAIGASQLYVKHDDRCGEIYGGNKVRKLEFVLADALKRGRDRIITFGAVGSNHLLATALYGRQLGLETVGVVFPQPVQHYVRTNLRCGHGVGCRYQYVDGIARAANRAVQLIAEQLRSRGPRPYVLWAGGSSTLGVLGYVEAALELAAQVEAGELPEPEVAFVPVGSAGTLAGLQLGCRLAGLRTQPVGVRIYDAAAANELTVTLLARRALAYLRRLDPSVPAVALPLRQVRMVHDQCGPGYAYVTDAARAAIEQARTTEGLELEGTYSGKAMAGFVEHVRQPANQGRPALFFDTYNSVPLEPLQRDFPGPQVFAPPLRAYFESPVGTPP